MVPRGPGDAPGVAALESHTGSIREPAARHRLGDRARRGSADLRVAATGAARGRDHPGTMSARSSQSEGITVRTIATGLALIVLVWLAAIGVPASAQRQQPSRLIVTNYTGTVIS